MNAKNRFHGMTVSFAAAVLTAGLLGMGCGQAADFTAVTAASEGSAAATTSSAQTNAKETTTAAPLTSSAETAAAAASALSDASESDHSNTEAADTDPVSQMVETQMASMTIEEKAAQIFFVSPYALTGVENATVGGETTRQAIRQYPVGGIYYLAGNLTGEEQTRALLSNTEQFCEDRVGIPLFLGVDEEGGTVARICGRTEFGDYPAIPDMAEVGASGDTALARQYGAQTGKALSELGFNTDFAPVADVLTNSANTVVRKRSFGSDPQLVASMGRAFADGLSEYGILSTYKHFPGHGNTSEDSHKGLAFSDRDMESLKECELIPFADGIVNNVPFIMVGHISLPNILGNDTPSSMSPEIVTELLRNELEFDNIIITDDLAMGAIADQYGTGAAAVQAFLAGNDMLLVSARLPEYYQGILDAVQSGTITEERMDESVRRILTVKFRMNSSQQTDQQ